MRRDDLVEMLAKIPREEHRKLILVLHNSIAISVDTIFRTEPEYLVLRGRESGTTDENRAFLLPYSEVTYLKLDRVVKVSDLERMFGAAEPVGADVAAPAAVVPEPAPALDPATIAKQNLLERLRATRTSAGSRDN